jgi:hypothetical protein
VGLLESVGRPGTKNSIRILSFETNVCQESNAESNDGSTRGARIAKHVREGCEHHVFRAARLDAWLRAYSVNYSGRSAQLSQRWHLELVP